MSKERLRVLILTHNIVRKGGAYYRGLNLGRGLAALGHKVTLMGISERNRFRFDHEQEGDIEIVHSPDLMMGIGRTGWDPWDTLRRMLWMRKRPFDVIYTVDTRPAVVLPALYARNVNGGVYIADWTDWWGRGGASSERSDWFSRTIMAPVEQYFEEAFRNDADGTVHISHALGKRAVGLGVDESTMCYLPTGCDVEAIPSQPLAQAREQLGLDPNATYLGYLGNIYQRDCDLMVDALRQLESVPNAKLLMIGGARPRFDAGFEASGRLHKTGHIDFDDMLAHLAACDVLLLPLTDSIANRGRWPSKINDYLAVGRPVVASAVGDLTFLFRENDIGLLADPDPAHFAAQIDALLNNPQDRAQKGLNARRLAETTQSSEAVAARLEDFLLRTVEKARAQGKPFSN